MPREGGIGGQTIDKCTLAIAHPAVYSTSMGRHWNLAVAVVCAACGGSVATPVDGGPDAIAESSTDSPASDVVAALACSAPAACTSGTTSTDAGSAHHDTGQPCIACHTQSAGPIFSLAGTVFPTCHEPDFCNGLSGATVTITDTNANPVITLTTDVAGNFEAMSPPLPASFGAILSHAGNQTAATTVHTDGDCNKCHTEGGTNGAPGRLFVP